MAKGIKRKLTKAYKQVNREIAGMSVGKYGAGLASEGYAGGYRDALSDVLLALNGVKPNRRGYWDDAFMVEKWRVSREAD